MKISIGFLVGLGLIFSGSAMANLQLTDSADKTNITRPISTQDDESGNAVITEFTAIGGGCIVHHGKTICFHPEF